MNTLDRIIRVIIFITALILFTTNILTGILGITLLVIGGVLLLTSFINFCPIYRILGINTCKIK